MKGKDNAAQDKFCADLTDKAYQTKCTEYLKKLRAGKAPPKKDEPKKDDTKKADPKADPKGTAKETKETDKTKTTDASKTTAPVAKGNAAKGEYCVSTTANTGCGEGLRCAKLKLSDEAKKKAEEAAKAAGVKVTSGDKEMCVGKDKCDGSEKDGSTYTCGAKALAASLVATLTVLTTM